MINIIQLHELFQSRNLSALVQNAREILSNPIVVTDLSHNVLEISDEPDLSDPKWLEIAKSRKVFTTDSVSDVYHRSIILRKPLLCRDIEDSVDVLRTAICHGDQLIGFLEIPCYNKIPDSREQELIMFCADIACMIMKKDLGYLYTPSDDKYSFIIDLIEGQIKDENVCKVRCKSLQWNIKNHYFRIMTITGKEPEEPLTRKQIIEIRNDLRKLFQNITSILYGNVLKVIVLTKEDTVIDGNFFSDIINYLKKHHLEAGISRSTNLLTEMSRCNKESEKALTAGQILKSEEIIFFYEKYSVYHVLEICNNKEDVMHFCHPAIIKLADYDRVHNTTFLDTLRVYLYTNQNITKASDQLFIHRNTLTNRLLKISDLIHVDLHDNETVFHLMFSFHILEYVGSNITYDYQSRIKINPHLKHQ